MTPKLRKIINENIPKGVKIGKGWAEENTDEIGKLASSILINKIESIFEICRKNRERANAIKER